MQSLPIVSVWMVFFMTACNGQRVDTQEKNVIQTVPVISVQQVASDIERGIVYRSSDDGATWTDISQGLPETLFITDLAVSDQLLAMATKEQGVFLFELSGNIWNPMPSKPATTSNLDALVFFQHRLFAGTERSGVFVSADLGRSWQPYSQNLGNLTVRKFAIIDNKLYAGTNGGLYSLNATTHQWVAEYEEPGLQVNGIAELDGDIYIGTNTGVFKASKGQQNWKSLMADRSLHNISSDGKNIYAMVYSELMVSADKGATWQNRQKGLPPTLYTFQVMKTGDVTLAGQWDGVYKKGNAFYPDWSLSSNGLPEKFAVTEMTMYKNNLIITSSTRTAAKTSKNHR